LQQRIETRARERKPVSVLHRDRNIRRFAETLAGLCGHGRRNIGGGSMSGRADGGERGFWGKAGARGYVKDAHARRKMGGAQQKGHEACRDVRESPVVFCRRLVPEA
jgi:hypothetical protein